MRRVPRYLADNAIACLALFVALGGSSYAVARLPGNSVGSRQIATNAVGVTEIRRSAVGTGELRDRAVRAPDLGRNSVGAAAVADDSIGASEVQNNVIGPDEVQGLTRGDLSFAPLVNGDVKAIGSNRSDGVPVVAGTGFASVGDITVDAVNGDAALLSATIEVENPDDGNGPIQVNSRITHNGAAHHGTFTMTLQDGETGTMPHWFVCDESPGANAFAIEIEGSGKGNLTVGDRQLQALIGLL
jgi:hypothetical protein